MGLTCMACVKEDATLFKKPHAACVGWTRVTTIKTTIKHACAILHKCMCIVDQAASSAVIVPAATQLANDMLSAVHDA